jgi:hypothetical protein
MHWTNVTGTATGYLVVACFYDYTLNREQIKHTGVAMPQQQACKLRAS